MKEHLQAARLNYPRVSEIIHPYSRMGFENIDMEVLANACERGTKVHAICKALMDGYFIPSIDEECKPYIDSFNLWMGENKFTAMESEKRYYDDENKFTGQIDMIVKQDGKTILYDIKTSATKSKAWPVQLTAYAHLIMLGGTKIDSVAVIQLKKTGKKPTIHQYEDLTEYGRLFTGLLLNYNYFLRKKEKTNERN